MTTTMIDWNTILLNSTSTSTCVADSDTSTTNQNDESDIAVESSSSSTNIIPIIQVDSDCFVAIIPTIVVLDNNNNNNNNSSSTLESSSSSSSTTTKTKKRKKKSIIMDEPSIDIYPYQLTVIATLNSTTTTTTNIAQQTTDTENIVESSATATTTNNNNNNRFPSMIGYTIHMYSVNATTISPSFYTLLQYFNHNITTSTTTTTVLPNNNNNNNNNTNVHNNNYYNNSWNITIQTFAKQPRQYFPILDSSNRIEDEHHPETTSTTIEQNQYIRTLRICYFTITQSIFGCNSDSSSSSNWMTTITTGDTNGSTTASSCVAPLAIELIQCTVTCDWKDALLLYIPSSLISSSSSSSSSSLQQQQQSLPVQLTLSCTMSEFQKFIQEYVAGISNHHPNSNHHSNGTSSIIQITELYLKLHFTISDIMIQEFCNALLLCTSSSSTTMDNNNLSHNTLQILSIEYLDLSDKGWEIFCTTFMEYGNRSTVLLPQIHTISLDYTEKFIDTYRRISVDRCIKRTELIYQLVQTMTSIQYIYFPIYQQDSHRMKDIYTILEQRRVV